MVVNSARVRGFLSDTAAAIGGLVPNVVEERLGVSGYAAHQPDGSLVYHRTSDIDT